MNSPLHITNTSKIPRFFWHPTVVYIPEGFGGHQWWMAESPYHPVVELKPYRARWELPCVHYSDDGILWKSIANNPVDDLTEQQILDEDYLSDPHLVYKDGVLELSYRLTLLTDKQIQGNKTVLYKKTSVDGVDWSERIVVADLRRKEDVEIWGEQIISQAILWTGTEYQCWYVDGSGYEKNRGIKMTTSEDGVHWTKAKQCKIVDYKDTPWHIDVQQIDGAYHMLCYGDTSGKLAYLTSEDGRNWQYKTIVISPSHSLGSFYSQRIYRSCAVKAGEYIHIYFSAATAKRSYIGLLRTKDWKKFEHVSPRLNITYGIDVVMELLGKATNKIQKKLHIR